MSPDRSVTGKIRRVVIRTRKTNKSTHAKQKTKQAAEGDVAAVAADTGGAPALEGGAAAVPPRESAPEGGAAALQPQEPAPAEDESTIAKFVQLHGSDDLALAKYIAGFTAGNSPVLGQAAPCRSYRSLVCLSVMNGLAPQLQAAESKGDITSAFNNFKVYRNAFADLLAMSKAAHGRLKNAIEEAKKKKSEQASVQQEAIGRRRSNRAAAASPASVSSFVDRAGELATAVPSVVVDACGKVAADQSVDLSKPVIFRPSEATLEVGEVKAAIDAVIDFADNFKSDPVRSETGRSQRKLSIAQHQAMRDMYAKMLGDENVLPEDKATPLVQPTLCATKFSIAKGNVSCSAEYGHVATIRHGVHGTRSVLAVASLPLLEHLSKVKKAQCSIQVLNGAEPMDKIEQCGDRSGRTQLGRAFLPLHAGAEGHLLLAKRLHLLREGCRIV